MESRPNNFLKTLQRILDSRHVPLCFTALRVSNLVLVYIAWKPSPYSKERNVLQQSWRNVKGMSFLHFPPSSSKDSIGQCDNNSSNPA